MTTTPNPANPLGDRLRAARGAMLSKSLAADAGWPPSKVSKIETGRQLPTEDDLRDWARIVDAPPGSLQQWTAMLEQARALRRSYHDDLLSGRVQQQKSYTQVLASATRYRFYEKVFVPRFLQTPAYSAAMLRHMDALTTPDIDQDTEQYRIDLAAAVAERQSSGLLVYDTHRQFEVLLDEAVLRTWRFSPEIMRGQLSRLESVIDLPNIRLGILPQDRFLDTFAANAYEIVDDRIYIELHVGDVEELQDDRVAQYHLLTDRLWNDAVTGTAAAELIGAARRAVPH